MGVVVLGFDSACNQTLNLRGVWKELLMHIQSNTEYIIAAYPRCII